jgi:hypothetical protein
MVFETGGLSLDTYFNDIPRYATKQQDIDTFWKEFNSPKSTLELVGMPFLRIQSAYYIYY